MLTCDFVTLYKSNTVQAWPGIYARFKEILILNFDILCKSFTYVHGWYFCRIERDTDMGFCYTVEEQHLNGPVFMHNLQGILTYK
jgi:hypothetical protein